MIDGYGASHCSFVGLLGGGRRLGSSRGYSNSKDYDSTTFNDGTKTAPDTAGLFPGIVLFPSWCAAVLRTLG